MISWLVPHGRIVLLVLITVVAPAAAAPPVVIVPGLNFSGSGFGADSSFIVADANGAIGRAHYVEFVNGHFAVYSKTNGARLASKTHRQFWQDAGLSFASQEAVDPRTLYDPSADRWYTSSVEVDPANLSSNRLLLAVSATGNPMSGWHGFALPGAHGRFADFATLGYDRDGVYVAAYVVTGSDGTRGTNLLLRIPKQDLLGAVPRSDGMTVFPLLHGLEYGNILQPAVNLDGTATGAILAAASLGWDRREHTNLVGMHVLRGSDGASWDVAPVPISVPPFSRPDEGVQPDGSDLLAIGDTRLSASVYEVNGVLHAVHSTRQGNRSALRWYRIRATDFLLLETGTIADPELDLYYPSIAANRAGVVVIGFNGSSTTSFISSYAIAGATRNGQTTFGPRILLKAGNDSYTNLSPSSGNFRWGDYSATSVDPEDPFRFWTIQLYPYSAEAWQTQITELRTALPQLAISRAGSNVTVSWYGSPGVLTLETTSSLAPPAWEPVNETTVNAEGVNEVTLSAVDRKHFFRLRGKVSETLTTD